MPRPYSEDLRERVLKVVDEKKITMEEISKMFKIDRKTIYWWRKRREETGSIKPSSGYQKGHSHKIKDLDSFAKFLDENRDITVEKIIEKFGNICKDTVYNYLKKVNYTYKKNFSLPGEE
ncbi:IS630 transposase-related protein [Wolbachia pipientis]|uniref:IS630 transposase-related protein n=1 Tax=Wolbachia pipientis TaxID=955 RepID=UPI0020309612|nr:IS630 transposase-related protein [Wolbachia pipientis]MCM1002344.1 IS630 transposase-related protein [Wolbachia pipientis]